MLGDAITEFVELLVRSAIVDVQAERIVHEGPCADYVIFDPMLCAVVGTIHMKDGEGIAIRRTDRVLINACSMPRQFPMKDGRWWVS